MPEDAKEAIGYGVRANRPRQWQRKGHRGGPCSGSVIHRPPWRLPGLGPDQHHCQGWVLSGCFAMHPIERA